MKKKNKFILSIFLALSLIIGIMPKNTAYAKEGNKGTNIIFDSLDLKKLQDNISSTWVLALDIEANYTAYKVTFDANGGSCNEKERYVKGHSRLDQKLSNISNLASNTTVALPAASKSGYAFVGWFSGSRQVDESTKVNGNMKLVAHYRKTHNISYNLNGVSAQHGGRGDLYDNTVTTASNPSGQITSFHAEQTVTLKDPIRNGYKFIGWIIKGKSSGRIIDGSTIPYGVNEDLEATAYWQLEQYTLTFNLGTGATLPSGKALPTDRTMYNVEEEISLESPERPYYTFNGWKDQNGTAIGNKIPKGSYGNKVYATTWKEKRITATPVAVEGVANGTTYRPSVTTNPSGCTIYWGSTDGNYNYGTSAPGYTSKGRYTVYFKAQKDGWFETTGRCVVTVRNPQLTSRSYIEEKGNGSFDVRGNGGSIGTTYANQGYHTFVNINGSTTRMSANTQTIGNFTITRTTSGTNEYGYVRTTYTIRNNSGSAQNISIGFGTDTMLNGNDRVPVSVVGYGIQASSGVTYAYYLRNTDGVDNCNTCSVGQYGNYTGGASVFTNGPNYYDGDSGIGASWTRTVPAYGTIEISWGIDML